MRYVLAGLIAALVLVFDFAQNALDQPQGAQAHDRVLERVASDVLEPKKDVANPDPTTSSEQNLEEHIRSGIGNETSNDSTISASTGVERSSLSLNQICEAIKVAAEESDIPVAFFARLLWQESNFRSEEVSSAGARGIAQFMPQTAAEVGLSDPFDPLQAIPASAKFLRKLHNRFGNLGLAAAAYNAGGGRIEKWLSRRGPLPQETRAYVKIITGNKAEDWTAESKTISVPTHLPRQARCDGVDGLSNSKHSQVAEVPVKLTSAVSEMLRKAEADEAEARLIATRNATRIGMARARIRSLARAKPQNSKAVSIAARMQKGLKVTQKTRIRLAAASSR